MGALLERIIGRFDFARNAVMSCATFSVAEALYLQDSFISVRASCDSGPVPWRWCQYPVVMNIVALFLCAS